MEKDNQTKESILENKKEASRKKSLGELGELFAIKALVDKKFDQIRNLNDSNITEPFADIFCVKDGVKYIVSVKARNKYQKNGKLNSSYNLGNDAFNKAEKASKKYDAIPCWLAIQFDYETYSIYFGELSELGNQAIPINKCTQGLIGQKWETNKRHYFDFDFYQNR
jgi:hypothetical protein